jgi:MoxR-like ATPase
MNAVFDPSSLAICPAMQAAAKQLNTIVLGKELQIKLSLSCILAGGHLLINDLPGMGKTVLSHALAKVCGLDFKRVQFTNDLLPADLIGTSIFQRDTGSFTFAKGPVFCELLLADEINRATPKTQSALLEAMEERQVSVEGESLALPYPFIVIATQNPDDQLGTSPLPESQLDRFLLCLSMGYPDRAAELDILAGQSRREILAGQQQLIDLQQLREFQASCQSVQASAEVLQYLYSLLDYSRHVEGVLAGLSTRAGLGVLSAAKAWAWLSGDSVLMPQHIQSVFGHVAGHRLQNTQGKGLGAQKCLELLGQVAIPR